MLNAPKKQQKILLGQETLYSGYTTDLDLIPDTFEAKNDP